MPEETEGTEGLAQLERFMPEAATLEDRDVKTFCVDPVLALQNATDGTEAVLAVGEARLRAELPALDIEKVRRIPDVALAVSYAVRRVEAAGGPGTLGLLREATALRGKLLAAAQAFAKAGLVPEAKVKKIQQGRGAIDMAKDCVDLAALFTENAEAIRGKSPVAAAEVRRAGEVGAELQAVLKPKGSPRSPKPAEVKAAAKDRDRLGTLLAKDYDRVRRAAAWLFGAEADALAPPLGLRSAARRRPKPAEPTPPT